VTVSHRKTEPGFVRRKENKGVVQTIDTAISNPAKAKPEIGFHVKEEPVPYQPSTDDTCTGPLYGARANYSF
jgi:hypothetical protein